MPQVTVRRTSCWKHGLGPTCGAANLKTSRFRRFGIVLVVKALPWVWGKTVASVVVATFRIGVFEGNLVCWELWDGG